MLDLLKEKGEGTRGCKEVREGTGKKTSARGFVRKRGRNKVNIICERLGKKK